MTEKCVALVFGGIHALNVVSVVSGKVVVVEDLSSSPTSYNPITENFVHSIFPFITDALKIKECL